MDDLYADCTMRSHAARKGSTRRNANFPLVLSCRISSKVLNGRAHTESTESTESTEKTPLTPLTPCETSVSGLIRNEALRRGFTQRTQGKAAALLCVLCASA